MSAKRILVVEAEETQNFCLSRLLTHAGYQVSGAKAISEALNLTQTVKPDIILIDEKLPDGDGFTLCQQITSVEGNWSVVMMSEYSRPFEQEKASALGAQACLAKPFKFDALCEELSKIVQ